MALPLRFPIALLALAAVTACASPPETTPPAAEEPAMVCQADKGQWAIGQIADEALVAKVKADTTSDRVRVIRPGMAVTMDYREDRVNLDVDADNRVTAVRCT
ncbi:MAG TPA: I78 family peptidase inhibitor [Arenimonas sp.]|nr:I78 family peptidase inhibitor [Arenimonas sp.]